MPLSKAHDLRFTSLGGGVDVHPAEPDPAVKQIHAPRRMGGMPTESRRRAQRSLRSGWTANRHEPRPACTVEAANRNGSIARVGSVGPNDPEITQGMSNSPSPMSVPKSAGPLFRGSRRAEALPISALNKLTS